MSDLFIERALEANDGTAVVLDSFEDCVVGTIEIDGVQRVVYSLGDMTEKILADGVSAGYSDDDEYGRAQALADAYEIFTRNAEHLPADRAGFAPLLLEDV